MKKIYDCIVIGGGPAGIMASLFCDKSVLLIDHNEKIGKKLYITGKGRCNLTNLVGPNEYLENVVNNRKFLYSAINNFSSFDAYTYFEDLGVKLKVERGNRVFPESDKSSDIIKALAKELARKGVNIALNENVMRVDRRGEYFAIETNNNTYEARTLVIATGGVSYTATGSTGDGYRWANSFGHSIVEPKPALVGIKLDVDSTLAGISLKNVQASVFEGDRKLCSLFGEMLFTHTGVSGPIILSISSLINRLDYKKLRLSIDLKPALSEEQLDVRLLRDFEQESNKQFKNYIHNLIPRGLIDDFLSRLNFDVSKQINSVTKEDRQNIIRVLKNYSFAIKGLEDIEGAIVTSGGVNVGEINPKTMESKLVPNLYFAGEVLDVDAFTGGFNIQIALSTGALAGLSISKKEI